MGFSDNEFGTLFTCFHAYVIEVCIEEEKLKTGLLFPEESPCADPRQCGIPSLVWNLGIFGEPKITLLQYLKFINVIKYGRMLALFFSVVPAYADVIEAR